MLHLFIDALLIVVSFVGGVAVGYNKNNAKTIATVVTTAETDEKAVASAVLDSTTTDVAKL